MNQDYIVHLYDGKKLVSAASDNVAIDLRAIASELGKFLVAVVAENQN